MTEQITYRILEIKPYGFESRIWDVCSYWLCCCDSVYTVHTASLCAIIQPLDRYSDLRGCCIFLTWGRSLNLIGSAKGFLRLWRNFCWILFSMNQLLHVIIGLRGVFLASNSLHNLGGWFFMALKPSPRRN